MDNLIGSLRNYGIIEGLSLYIKLKNNQIDTVTTTKLTQKVHLRPGTTDRCVFKQIFLKQDLNISVLDSFIPETIIDLGANIGMSSLYFANRFPNTRIIGVEPDNGNGEMFKKNLRDRSNVTFELSVVRGDNKKIEMRDHGKGDSGYVAEESEAGVPAVTISDIMNKYDLRTLDILKMDIEGSEKSVFESNYERWLPNTKVLLVELHERKVPGCNDAFNNALNRYNFQRSKSGEYEVLVNQDKSLW